ncbi:MULTISPECIES: DUF1223 domain-containing protein [unclassified Pseudoxanthomonas]|uniref:DUF1223 domain-containing protein n=1 Tax=unclassified Pseudoxanthomonas TaxID=2645906 RepID=UPI0030786C90
MKQTLSGLAAALICALGVQNAGASCLGNSGERLVPLVELYTAEGCNECPAADRWMSELSKQPASTRPSLLALHVDYWDEIGWPDRFAAPLHGKRQEARVMLAGKRVVYTPQVMVGRDTQVDWRDSRRFESSLQQQTGSPPVDLTLQAERRQGDSLQVRFSAVVREKDHAQWQPLLWLALYQNALGSVVTAGENKGMTLRHDRVVRSLRGPWKMQEGRFEGEVGVSLPQAEADQLGLVLFAESSRTGAGLQSLELPLSACLR